MEKDPTTPDQALEESAAVLGELLFEKQRQEAVAKMQAIKLAKLEWKIETQKRLIYRTLNREEKKQPHLRVVK